MAFNTNATWLELVAAPDTPGEGKQKIYPKTDGKWYVLDDEDNEREVFLLPDGSGSVITGNTGATDNAILRADGTGGASVQASGITIDDSNNVTLPDSQLIRAELKDYAETVATDASSGTTHTIDLETGNVHDLTLTDNCTLTFSNPPASGRAGSFTLILRQDGTGGRTVTYPASVKWAGGTPPTLSTGASAVDILTFCTVDAGSTWFGFLAGLDFS